MIIDFCSFNIRGLNKKQTFAKDFLSINKLSLFALLETHVKKASASFVSKFIGPRFNWHFNYDYHYNGRIWVGVDPSIWNLNVLRSSAQHVTCSVSNISGGEDFVISFIYGFNTAVERRVLWSEILDIQRDFISDSMAWCLIGDFNVCLGPLEASNGINWSSSMLEFHNFVSQLGVADLQYTGALFTWWDCSLTSPVFKKLDRCMVNVSWLSKFALSQAKILTRGISDHCPVAVSLGRDTERTRKPFHFFNHLISVPGFLEEVKKAWQVDIVGNPWFVLTSKLKHVKVAMRQLNRTTGHLSSCVIDARHTLDTFQAALPSVPSREQLLEESNLIKEFIKVLNLEEVFLKQKSRVSWLKCGDSNNKFFFNACKTRWNQNKILSIEDGRGNTFTSHSDISQVAVDFFTNLMGQTSHVHSFPEDLPLPRISDTQSEELARPFTESEIWNVVKNMPRNKCPGPDGFTVEFFVASWSIVGSDFCKGILYFFDTLQLPRIVNSVVLALVPKRNPTSTMSDFRPIACCNIMYKCITKLLALRLKKLMPSLISPSQSAFVPKRLIGDNILLAQGLFKNYHLETGPPRCAVKLDIKKAFDSLNWDFILAALTGMGFPAIFTNWIMTCITTCMISVKVNGSLEGYFKAASGLRQGDPMSPYLFVIAMEVLTSILKKKTDCADFKYHHQTQILQITHLTFADDVMLFCRGERRSIDLLLEGVADFAAISGLCTNNSKSTCFFANVDRTFREYVISSTGFQQGSLPVRYLGLPLISTKLRYRDCLPLIMRIKDKIENWTTKLLNHAGRLQLLKTVLFGLQGFWSAHLFLPKAVLKQLQSMFTHFLWSASSSAHKQVKVSWKDCALPKAEGGLGIRDLCEWNLAAFLHHLCRIVRRDSSLWISWFHSTLLRNKAFWTVPIPSKASWCVKKILQLRPLALTKIKYQVGLGSQFLFWHDPWLDNVPLLARFDNTIISIAETSQWAKVGDFITNQHWSLPPSNHTWVIDLREQVGAVNIGTLDKITWDGCLIHDAALSFIWNSIRSPGARPLWLDAVWHPLAVPKCSFLLWLALKNRLLTKERMLNFSMTTDLMCVLCNSQLETNAHLFSTCPYAVHIFSNAGFALTLDWQSYLNGQFLLCRSSRVKKLLSYLFLAAASFNIWKERNNRMHNPGHHLSPDIVLGLTKRLIREKVFSIKSFQKAADKDPDLILALY